MNLDSAFDPHAPSDSGPSLHQTLGLSLSRLNSATLGSWAVPETFVYFIVSAGRTKIGLTQHLEKRLATLQSSSAVEQQMVGHFPGSWNDEAKLHAAYAPHRLHGEWFAFEATPELVEQCREWLGAAKRTEERDDRLTHDRALRERRANPTTDTEKAAKREAFASSSTALFSRSLERVILKKVLDATR
jgi:hypothetical protein